MLLPKYKKKSLGQHFLQDQQIVQQLLELLQPQPTDRFIEIGPGAGALTKGLLQKLDRLEVIELDRELIPLLQHNCGHDDKLHIHHADILKVDLQTFAGKWRIVGNLPYNISTPLLFHLTQSIEQVIDLNFMLQREVAKRIVATPGTSDYGRLSVMTQYFFEARILLEIAPTAFSPPPKVYSAWVKLIPKRLPAINNQLLASLVRDAFNLRRKTIANSLKKYLSAKQLIMLEIDPTTRPENLDLATFIRLAEYLQ